MPAWSQPSKRVPHPISSTKPLSYQRHGAVSISSGHARGNNGFLGSPEQVNDAAVNISRPHLEDALRRVKQGIMQPDEAARWLLECTEPRERLVSPDRPVSPDRHERKAIPSDACTVEELMNHLGPPPLEIQRDWDRQVGRIALQFEQAHGEPLPPLSAADLYVDSENRLTLSPAIRPVTPSRTYTAQPAIGETTEPSQPTGITASGQGIVRKSLQNKNQSDENQSDKNTTRRSLTLKQRPWQKPVLLIAGVCVLFALVFYSFLDAPEESTRIASVSKKSNAPASSIFSPTSVPNDRSSTESAPTGDDASPDDLPHEDARSSPITSNELTETTAPTTSLQATPENQTDAPERATLGLSTFGDTEWISANELLPAADFDTLDNEAEAETATDPLSPEDELEETPDQSESDDEMAVEEDGEVESPIQQASSSQAIELPPLPASSAQSEGIEAVEIIGGAIDRLALHFPVETDITLVAKDEGWDLRDMKDQVLLANLTSSEADAGEGKPGLQFRWSPDAFRRPVAKQLPSGLMQCTFKDGSQRSVFLRQALTAEPWQVDFSSGDVKAAWPILLAPPVGPSSVDLEFQVPKTVTHSWIEPHDPNRVRRSQSICQFALESDSTIAIRSRIDLRVGNRIQLRARHAAQLDPSFPWQMISTSQIEKAITQVTNQLERAEFELTELKTAYSDAGTIEKKRLAPRRDAMESIIARLKVLNDRLHKFDQLLAQIDQTALMMIRLKVVWPETSPLNDQTIFEMNAP